jgi:hypothetical protein
MGGNTMPEFQKITREEYVKEISHGKNSEYADAINAALAQPVKAEYDDAKAAMRAASKLRGIAKRSCTSVVVTVRGTSVLIAKYEDSAIGKPKAGKKRTSPDA